MNFGWAKGLIRTGREFAVQNAPTILMCLGTVGTGSALIYAVKAGPKAVNLIEKEEVRKAEKERKDIQAGLEPGEKPKLVPYRIPLSPAEKIRTCWKLYIPPVGLALASIGCFWGAHGIDLKRQAVLAGLYSTAEASLQEYQRKVIEMLGEKQHEEIKDAIAEDNQEKKQEKLPVVAVGAGVGVGDIWCDLYGDMFPGNYNKIKEVQNEINHDMLTGTCMYASEADLKWKLDPTGEWMRPRPEDYHKNWNVDRLLVLHVANPLGPVAKITYEDKDGLENLPVPDFGKTRDG